VQYHDEWAQSTGDTAIIGKYKIVMAKADSYNKPLGCKTQSECGGTDSGSKDSDGCSIYSIPATTAQATATCNSAHPLWNGGSCEYCIDRPTQRYASVGWSCAYSYTVSASTCGGMKTAFTYECVYNAKVYYNNALIETIPTGTVGLTSDIINRGYLNGAISTTPELQIVFNNQHGYTNNVCRWIQNTIQIKPVENIEVNVATPQAQYFQGQQVNVDVQVINNGSNTLTGTLDVAYEIPTGLSNPSTQLDTKEITINSGVNTFSYTIPTTESTERIKITPSLKIYLPTTGLSGMSYDDGTGAKAITAYAKLPYGSVTESSSTVMIVPKPLYMTPVDGSCFAGYSINTIGNYCVRADIKSLTCYQIGCPKVEGHEYQCTSAGQCAETVYTTVWGNCPDGTTATTTDKGEQICIKTEIANVFLECSANSAKPAVCAGITATCTNNKWEFTGKCDVITEIQTRDIIKEVIVEKTIWGTCPTDSKTTTNADGSQVCVKTITQTNTVEVPVVKEVTKTEYISTSYIPNWIYYVVGALLVIVIAPIILKKRRR
jgi:hypothetical protein